MSEEVKPTVPAQPSEAFLRELDRALLDVERIRRLPRRRMLRGAYRAISHAVSVGPEWPFDRLREVTSFVFGHDYSVDDQAEEHELFPGLSQEEIDRLAQRVAFEVWTGSRRLPRSASELVDAMRTVACGRAEEAEARAISPRTALVKPAVPAPWERLSVLSDDVATLDGADVRLRGTQGEFLRQLVAAKGDCVKGGTLCSRPERVWRSLPPEIQELVEQPGRGHWGYRLRNP